MRITQDRSADNISQK